MVSDFILRDDSNISSIDIGQLVSEIHKVPLDGLSIIDQKDRSLSNIVASRITRRIQTLKKLININFSIPNTDELDSILRTSQAKKLFTSP